MGGAAEGASAFWPRWRSQWSMRTRAVIASAMGVARSPTQGSCRPVVTTSTGSPDRSMLRPGRRRLEVGFKAMLATMS